MDPYWSDKLAEQLRPKICAEQVEWFSFAHLSAALRKALAEGERIGRVKSLREAANLTIEATASDEIIDVAEELRERADRIERGEDA